MNSINDINEAKYRSVIESMDDSIYMVDRDCRYLFMNKKHLERLGRSSELFKESRYHNFHSEEESLNFSKNIRDIFSSGNNFEEKYETDGKEFVRIFSPVKNINDDNIIAVNVISKQNDKNGNGSEGEDSIYIVDENCRYLSINAYHMERLGINSEETFLGRSYDEFHPKGKNENFSRIITEVFDTGETKRDEYESDSHHFVRRFCPVMDYNTGNVAAVTVVSTNVTDQKITEKSLIEANKKLNLLNSLTRHDILNQMTVLQGYLGLSLNSCNDEKLKVFLEKQMNAADTISHQILFTRDYQEIGISAPLWQDVPKLIRRTADTLNTHGIEIEDRCENLKIFADPLLEKVFYNLIENSIRHGRDLSKISFYYEKIPHGMKFIYEDDGAGISDEDKEKIFRQGYGKNTGLGLFLIREVLSITGFEIHETGTYGKGARFEIIIPEKMFSE